MTVAKQELLKKDAFDRLYIMNPTTLAEVAADYKLDANQLLRLNPEIASVSEPICHLILMLPARVTFSEEDWKSKREKGLKFALVKDPLRQYSQPIRPKISEIFRLLVDFDHQTRVYLKEIGQAYKKRNRWPLPKGCEIVTHIDCWDAAFDPENLLTGVEKTPYLTYRNDAYVKFTESVTKMGMFARDMTYLFHYCFNRGSITIKDSGRTKPALIFADKLCNVLLERLGEYLYIVSHFYHMSNGSYEDIATYQRAHVFIEATFGELLKLFSRKGTISHFTKYPDNFFVYDAGQLSLHRPFLEGVDGELFNDEYIFDFSLDYVSLQSDSRIEEIARKLDEGVGKFYESSHKEMTAAYAKSQALVVQQHAKEVKDYMTKTEPLVDLYKSKFDWAGRLAMQPELDKLRGYASSQIGDLRSLPVPVDDETLQRSTKQTNTAAQAYLLAMALHLIVMDVVGQTDLIEKFYKNVDELGEDFRALVRRLVSIAEKNRLSPDDAAKELEELSKELEPFQSGARQIIESYKTLDVVVKSLLILTTTFCGAVLTGTLVSGFLCGMQLSGGVVTAGIFTTQVLILTAVPAVAGSMIEGKPIYDSFSDFLKALGTTAIFCIVFGVVSRIMNVLVGVHAGTSVLVARYISTSLSFLIAGTPFFAYELHRRGQLNQKSEWIQFLAVQAISSTVLTGIFMAIEGRMMAAVAQAKLESTVWGVDARSSWEKIESRILSGPIKREMALAYEQRQKIDAMYRSLFKPSDATARQLLDAELSLLSKSRSVLNGLKSLNRDLRIFRKNVSMKRGHNVDISPECEVEAAEVLLTEAEASLKRITLPPDQNQALAEHIHNELPRLGIDSSIDGLKPLGKSTGFYVSQRIHKVIQKVPDIRHIGYKGSPLRIVDVPAVSVLRNLPERYREGILRLQGQWEHEGQRGTAEITIFDLNGKGVVPKEFLQERFKPQQEEPEPLAPAVLPKRGIEAYIEYSNKEPSEILKLLIEHPTELIWSDADLVALTKEIQKIGLEGLKQRGLKKMTVMRIQGNNIHGPKNLPAIFVADPFYFEGVESAVVARTLIGYGEKSVSETQGNYVWIWQADIDNLAEANWENARRCFEEYVRWGKEWYDYSGMDPNRPSKSLEGADVFALKSLTAFVKQASDFGFLKSDLTSKLTPAQWDRAWEARRTLLPEEGLIDRLHSETESLRIDKKDVGQQKPEYGIAKLLEMIGFFDLFSGDGRSRTFAGAEGGKEWLLLKTDTKGFQMDRLPRLERRPIEEVFTSCKKGEQRQ